MDQCLPQTAAAVFSLHLSDVVSCDCLPLIFRAKKGVFRASQNSRNLFPLFSFMFASLPSCIFSSSAHLSEEEFLTAEEEGRGDFSFKEMGEGKRQENMKRRIAYHHHQGANSSPFI